MTAAAPEVWTTPPGHTGFSALKVAGRIHAQIRDCAIAVIAPSGGGPAPAHVHAHDHLFVVLEGRITVTTDGKERVVDAFESIHVPGNTLHCVWNTTDSPAKVMGIGLVGESCKGQGYVSLVTSVFAAREDLTVAGRSPPRKNPVREERGRIMKAKACSLLWSAVALTLCILPGCGGGGSDASVSHRSLSVRIGGVQQRTLLPAIVVGSGQTLVDAGAFASMVSGLSFFSMANPPTPGMVLQYGNKISFVSAGFTTGFASADKVAMDSPLRISEDGTCWTPLNFLAKAVGGSLLLNAEGTSLDVALPLPHAIGYRVPEARGIAQNLEDDFHIRQGEIALTSAIDMYTAGYMPDCNGNNANNPYLVTQNPVSPRAQEFNRLPLGLYMDQDEAFVWVGYTPPECKYFSYQHYLMNRYYPDKTPTVRKIYARLGDSINSYNIGGSTSPFNRFFVLIVCSNQTTRDRVVQAASKSGISEDAILTLVLPADTVRFGLGMAADALTFLHRATLFERDSDKDGYVNSPPLEILRLTPKTPLAAYPIPTPAPRQRQTFVLEQDVAGLGALVERLQNSIIAKHGPEYAFWKILTTSTWMYPGGRDAIDSGTNVLGETNDTLYFQTRELTLHDDDLIVVYGAMHDKTGKGVYANVSCYGVEALNGIGGITSVPPTADAPGRVSYADTAKQYLPDASRGDQLAVYAYKFCRTARDNSTFAIPYNRDGSYKGFNNGDRVFMGFRIYVDNSTTIGPFPGSARDGDFLSYPGVPDSEVFFDQAILFTNTQP